MNRSQIFAVACITCLVLSVVLQTACLVALMSLANDTKDLVNNSSRLMKDTSSLVNDTKVVSVEGGTVTVTTNSYDPLDVEIDDAVEVKNSDSDIFKVQADVPFTVPVRIID